MSTCFENFMSDDMSGFRKNHGCHNVLVNFIENIKHSVDNGQIPCAVMTDLSRAFHCLPHRLVIAKMYAYGVSKNACKLIMNYFCGRQQCVKIGNVKREWLEIYKGTPQGSLFGPFMYNIFFK